MLLLKKRFYVAAVLLVMSLSVCACSDKGSSTDYDSQTDNDTGNSSAETKLIEDLTESSGKTKVKENSGEAKAKEGEDTPSEGGITYAGYSGEYEDSFSQRAYMEARDLGDGLKLTVHWSSSASESSIWTMTARFTSPDRLGYTDCEYGIIVFDDDGKDSYTREYDLGEGYFTLKDDKIYWDGASDDFCRDCVFEKLKYENAEEVSEIRHIEENVDIYDLPDGKYPVKIFFDNMKRNEDSLSLDFMIYTVIHYDPDEINNMKPGDILYEYVDETTTNNYVIDTVNFPIDEVCVVNGGSERGEGITFSLDDSGFYRVSVDEVYTRNSSHGMVTLEIPDSVAFEDNHNLNDSKLKGTELYDYFKGLSDSEKGYFNQNNTFIVVSDGKITGFNRVYLP